ncbi:MAG: hypothetical protein L3K15_00250 [Thermoplasmata archaeon]|nr:hypothetical protein [Thermoplasmata archaeon]
MSDYPHLSATRLGRHDNDVRLRAKNGSPLLFLGGACVIVALVLLENNLQLHSVRVPIWLLAFSVGIVALAGGLTAVIAGDFGGSRPARGPAPAGNREKGPPPELALGPPKSEKTTAPLGKGARLDRPIPRPVSGSVRASTAPPPAPDPSTVVAPLAEGPSSRAAHVPRPAERGSSVPKSDRGFDAAIVELESVFREMTRDRPSATPPSKPARSDAGPVARRPDIPPKAAPVKQWDESTEAPRKGRRAAGNSNSGAAELPPELADEFADLLNKFYPEIEAGAGRSEDRSPPGDPRFRVCPGCRRPIAASVEGIRCLRCAKPMCDDCRRRAANAKRALLCASCFGAYGVGSPPS